MTDNDYKDLAGITTSDKVSQDKAFQIAQKSKTFWISTWICFNGLQMS